MTRKLNMLDRQAVDLVMDRLTTTRSSEMMSMVESPPQNNVQAVEKILSLLAEMPAAEPSADLMTRTLQRIEQIAQQPVEPRQIPPYLGPGQLPA